MKKQDVVDFHSHTPENVMLAHSIHYVTVTLIKSLWAASHWWGTMAFASM